MSRLFRLSFALLVSWCVLVEIAEAVAGRLFGMEIDGDWYLLLTGSSAAELAAFFRLYAVPLAVAGVTLAFAAAAVFVLSFRASRRTLAAVVALCAAAVAVRAVQVGGIKAWKPLYVAFDTVRGMRLYGQIAAAGRWTPDRASQVAELSDGATNYVFVIGESMTSCRLPFYGYGRQTTPRLAALGDRLAKLGPMRVSTPYTALALSKLFVQDGASAAVRFRRAGYATFLASAQARWERYCSVSSAIFEACERKVYLSEVLPGAHVYDEMLLPHVREMTSGAKPFVLFVHLTGSHFDPRDRVPDGFAADEGLDDYDRSIRYTDKVLAEIIACLPPRTVLYYVSDHGESPDEGGWRNVRSPAMWQVPVLAYPASAAPARVDSVADFTAMWYNLVRL